MALEQMEGFELAGRTVSLTIATTEIIEQTVTIQLRVNTVHEKGTVRYTQQDSLDEAGGESTVSAVPAPCQLIHDFRW